MHPTKLLKGTKSKLLEGKKILVAVTSSIAAIESPKLMRELIRHGAEVYCIVTEEVKKIIGKDALKFGCGNDVYEEITGDIEHIFLYNECDCLLIYPATANIISKINLGIADNIVNTTFLMFFGNKPVFIVPAMHENMLKSIERHIDELKNKDNVYIVSPRFEEGKAKVASVEEIVGFIIEKIGNDLKRERNRVLILNGGTVEFIDKVRVITNLSSGKMGVALAEAFCKEGFYVEVITAMGLEPPYYIKNHRVLTAKEMLNKAIELAKDFDIIISSAAISDFTVESFEGKLSSEEEPILKLKRNPKVLEELRKAYKDKIIIGFKAEYNLNEEDLINKAKERLNKYNLNMIIANDLSKHYFGDDYTEVYIITKDDVEKVSGSKKEVAEKIVEKVVGLVKS
ncbi:bifunctional phosphopantothenoylcysteine decarboxylase/phosphopantothenate--cysteine ligase CoaBC [Methanocaldococcus fervens]|uniref:Coenzyme A biosynthesis bifunctional protein CoaBC n=1 Tax=Methanocaldococcus fervens (strain DSM 4213 / JCM 15782 / AG86) TaxID=573064 RepID=C7P5S1_METFA|nr:bifunctional phosphopantothenoylcysteine decarboxylase/phosphopantothenate--cysteine ligase CoaBC [Methanocaldococcus fervens]ACV23903.1 phosphopantothenoylcysteine decarboxylase/phosphopantothenate/cysteine ligase [Methanocaldococcus fervens AG86]